MGKHYCRIGKVISNLEIDRELNEASKPLLKGLEFSNDESFEDEL